MAVTAQQIAELAGVSRGTVDRALHNRGRVNPEVAAKIHKIAAELGYKPNLIGQALVKSRREFKLGAILQSTETPTMQIVRAGVQRAAEELAASGVELIMRENRGLDTEMVLEHIEELVSQGVQGLAIAPNNSPEIRQCIDELYEQGIPVITLNSDAPGSRRLAFIGMDNYRAGQTAEQQCRTQAPCCNSSHFAAGAMDAESKRSVYSISCGSLIAVVSATTGIAQSKPATGISNVECSFSITASYFSSFTFM